MQFLRERQDEHQEGQFYTHVVPPMRSPEQGAAQEGGGRLTAGAAVFLGPTLGPGHGPRKQKELE